MPLVASRCRLRFTQAALRATFPALSMAGPSLPSAAAEVTLAGQSRRLFPPLACTKTFAMFAAAPAVAVEPAP